MKETDRLERVTISLPLMEAKRLRHFAVDSDQSTSAIVRTAVAEYMAKPDKQISQQRASQTVASEQKKGRSVAGRHTPHETGTATCIYQLTDSYKSQFLLTAVQFPIPAAPAAALLFLTFLKSLATSVLGATRRQSCQPGRVR